MPIYEYDCPSCGDFTALRSMSQCREPQPCPACGADAPRVVLTAPRLTVMSASTRKAHETNERAAHEPKSSKSHVHGPGCGCGSGKKSSAVKTAAGAKAFPNKRPWMISH